MSSATIHAGASRRRVRSISGCVVAAMLTVTLGACGSDDEANDDAAATIDDLEDQLAAETDRADDAEAKLELISSQFPIEVTASLEEFDLIGAYTMKLTEAYCAGLAQCGRSGQNDIRADIIQGSNGLELQIPSVLTAGLFAINGSLFAVTDSDQIVDPCGATPRAARVSTTIFADGISVADDGTRTLTGLGASLLVSVGALEGCEEGVVFYAASLTPA